MTTETTETNVNATTADVPFDLPEVNENGNTPAQQKAADLAKEKKAKAPRKPKEPKPAAEPKLTVKEVVLAGLALDAAGLAVTEANHAVLATAGAEDSTPITAKVIIDRLATLIPGNSCTSIAWYKNALKPQKGSNEPKISFLDTDGTVTVATKVWVDGFVPPKAPRKNSTATKTAQASHDDKAYADAMDEWARQQGIDVDAPNGYELTPEQLAQFEADFVAAQPAA